MNELSKPKGTAVIKRHVNIIVGEVAKAGRHLTSCTVKHNIEKRHAAMGDERRVDQGAQARTVFTFFCGKVKAQYIVDIFLVKVVIPLDVAILWRRFQAKIIGVVIKRIYLV